MPVAVADAGSLARLAPDATAPSALPVDLVGRHELAWALDTLARDLVLELDDSLSGSEYVPGRDAHWWQSYPGW